jgi:hypothetical protein
MIYILLLGCLIFYILFHSLKPEPKASEQKPNVEKPDMWA